MPNSCKPVVLFHASNCATYGVPGDTPIVFPCKTKEGGERPKCVPVLLSPPRKEMGETRDYRMRFAYNGARKAATTESVRVYLVSYRSAHHLESNCVWHLTTTALFQGRGSVELGS